MTNDASSAIMETPNSALTVAQSKEDAEMLRATEKSPHYTVGSAATMNCKANQIP